MNERPILFSAPMVRALLAGTKTVTRRIVKLPTDTTDIVVDPGGSVFGPGPYIKPRREPTAENDSTMHPRIYCPFGYPGERLWVRETHAQFAVGDRTGLVPQCVAYRATCNEDGSFDYVNNGDEIIRLSVTKWTPSIFMPRWASRISLEVTAVRVERLHAITEEQARAEGVKFGELQPAIVNGEIGQAAFFNARDAFAYLWAGINGAASWKANPWVWVVEFKCIVKKPITDEEVREALAIGAAERKQAEKRTLRRRR